MLVVQTHRASRAPIMTLQLTGLIIFLINPIGWSQGSSLNSSLFQCQASSQGNGKVFTPNIPDFYFNLANVVSAGQGSQPTLTTLFPFSLYILSLPPLSVERNCTGLAISFEYCYTDVQRLLGSARSIFSFLTLTQDGFQFTVDSRDTIETTPTNETCLNFNATNMICCDQTNVTFQNIDIPAPGHKIGISTRRPIQTFSAAAEQYQSENFQLVEGNVETSRGSTFNLTEENLIGGLSLPLLRFVIVPETTESNIPVSESVSEITDDGATTSAASNNSAIIVGAAVGVALAILCIMAVAATIGVLLIRKKKVEKEKVANLQTPSSTQLPNGQEAVYKPPTLLPFNMNTNESYNRFPASPQISVIEPPASTIYSAPDEATVDDDESTDSSPYYEYVN